MVTPLNVLVVDDQPGIRYLFESFIRDSGHRVFSAANGLEAIEMVKKEPPDLVFMDVRMPIMSGLEALPVIKSLSPRTSVVIMTAYSADDTTNQALAKGALRTIAKPFDVDEIKSFIEEFAWNHYYKSSSGVVGKCAL